jgi:hypothetical protein
MERPNQHSPGTPNLARPLTIVEGVSYTSLSPSLLNGPEKVKGSGPGTLGLLLGFQDQLLEVCIGVVFPRQV